MTNFQQHLFIIRLMKDNPSLTHMDIIIKDYYFIVILPGCWMVVGNSLFMSIPTDMQYCLLSCCCIRNFLIKFFSKVFNTWFSVSNLIYILQVIFTKFLHHLSCKYIIFVLKVFLKHFFRGVSTSRVRATKDSFFVLDILW